MKTLFVRLWDWFTPKSREMIVQTSWINGLTEDKLRSHFQRCDQKISNLDHEIVSLRLRIDELRDRSAFGLEAQLEARIAPLVAKREELAAYDEALTEAASLSDTNALVRVFLEHVEVVNGMWD